MRERGLIEKVRQTGMCLNEDPKTKTEDLRPCLKRRPCGLRNSCNSNYIGYTSHHLHLRIEEHKSSIIGKHLKDKHNQRHTNLHEHFTTLKKCHGKFECLIYEMILIRKKRPTLNTQNDSIPAEQFISIF